MPLPSEQILSASIYRFVEAQSKLDPNATDPIKEFSDGFAKIILDAIGQADVIGVQTVVSGGGASGPITGTGIQNNTGKLK